MIVGEVPRAQPGHIARRRPRGVATRGAEITDPARRQGSADNTIFCGRPANAPRLDDRCREVLIMHIPILALLYKEPEQQLSIT